MKAVQFARYGGPEVLELVEVDEPHAAPGQVRIAVHAAGVNGIDWKIRADRCGGRSSSEHRRTRHRSDHPHRPLSASPGLISGRRQPRARVR